MRSHLLVAAVTLATVFAPPAVTAQTGPTAKAGAQVEQCDIGKNAAQMGIDFSRPAARTMKLYRIYNGKPIEVRIADVMNNGTSILLIVHDVGASSRNPVPPHALFTWTEVEKRTRYERLKAQGYPVCTPTLSREEAARRLETARRANTKAACTKYANAMRGGPKYDLLSYQRTLRTNCCTQAYVRELGYAPLCQRPLP